MERKFTDKEMAEAISLVVGRGISDVLVSSDKRIIGYVSPVTARADIDDRLRIAKNVARIVQDYNRVAAYAEEMEMENAKLLSWKSCAHDLPLACPYCGAIDAVEVRAFGEGFQVFCSEIVPTTKRPGCGATGGARPTRQAAIRAWNLRATTEPDAQ